MRLKILTSLSKSQKTPKQLSEEYKIAISHISRALKELEIKEIIRCLTPTRRKGKFFIISPKGKKILEKIGDVVS